MQFDVAGQAKEQLHRVGYAVVPGFICPQSVDKYRSICEHLLDANSTEALNATDFLSSQDLRDLVFSDRAIDTMRRLFGGAYALYPNLTVRRNAATDWHLDAAFTYGLGGTSEEPQFVQCAVYLQPNIRGQGGGIDAVPESHKRFVFGDREYVPAQLLSVEMFAKRVECAAGDLVIWDARLLHRSSPPGARAQPKYAIHWTASRSTSVASKFLTHLLRRGEGYMTADPRLMARYRDIAKVALKEHVPQDARARLSQHGVTLVTAEEFLEFA